MKEKKYFMDGIFRETPKGSWPYATRCKKCGATFFPAVSICGQCMSEDLEEFDLPENGTLKTYTAVYRPVKSYPLPHCIGEVVYPDEKLDVRGVIKVDNPGELEKGSEFKIGSKTQLIVDTLWEEEDAEVIGFKFKITE